MARLPILTFHALDNRADVISLAPHVFRYGLARLHAAGYRTLGLGQAVDLLKCHAPVPDKVLVLTLDDGYQSVYDVALPALQEYSMTATVFVSVGQQGPFAATTRLPDLGGRPMLSWGELRSLHRAGIELGAHTLTHPNLARSTDTQLEQEMVGSQQRLEDGLGASVVGFAYPFGAYDRRALNLARRHFAYACSTRLGFATSHSDLHALERVDTYYLRTERLFDLILSPAWPWYVHARRVPRAVRTALTR